MTGRENSEENFEKQWKDAFDEWSETAPNTVWAEIDRQLVYEDLKVYKSKLAIYRWVAAAVVLLGISFSIIQYFGDDTVHFVTSAAIDVDAPNPEMRSLIALYEEDRAGVSSKELTKYGANHSSSLENGYYDYQGHQDDSQHRDDYLLLANYEMKTIDFNDPIDSDHEDKYIYYLLEYRRVAKKKQDENERYWAGIDVSQGSFNPNYSTNDNSLTSTLGISESNGFAQYDTRTFNSSSPTLRENMAPGESISMGVSFGMKLGDKWTLQSGVQYAKAGALTETNILVRTSTLQEGIPVTGQGKNVPAVASLVANENNVVEYDFEDVEMSNVFEFTSIPVKAGYLIMDSKFKMALNAGVVTNIYLGNRLTTGDSDVAELTIGPGDTSPYKNFSFSGLAGVQFGYRFLKRMDVILEPNYRQSINTLTKSNSNFKTNPSGFALMTGLRYNFN